jgi:hypothetical protein
LAAGELILHLDFVNECIRRLRTRSIHRQFVGYLAICEASNTAGRQDELRPSFKKFCDRFMLVGNPDAGSPYLVPFNESGSLESSTWLNANVAGSYAPSSLRPQAPLRRVVDVYGSGRDATFSLRTGHEELCLKHLLFDEPVDVLALAGFLLRDHSFLLSNDTQLIDAETVITSFLEVLGFANPGYEPDVIFAGPDESLIGAFLYSEVAE